MTLNCWKFEGGKFKKWRVCAMALLSFAAGSLITGRRSHIDRSLRSPGRSRTTASITSMATFLATGSVALTGYGVRHKPRVRPLVESHRGPSRLWGHGLRRRRGS